MKLVGNNVIRQFNDLLFPVKCVGCNKIGEWLCRECGSLLKIDTSLICSIDQFDNLWAVADYNSPIIKKVIELVKYNFATEIAVILEKLIRNYFARREGWDGNVVLVPVPLHRRRELWRGFNQAELICQLVNKILGNPINSSILKRKINSRPQAKLKGRDRLSNVKGIFEANKNELIPDKIVLVDDVYTTGSTMKECAEVLKNGGCRYVCGLVVARG